MALNNTADKPISRHDGHRTPEEIEHENYLLTILKQPEILDRVIEFAREREGGISLLRLERVPTGWKPVKTYFGDFSKPSEALASARQEAKRVALERGFGPGARFGVYFDMAPNVRPYAEPQACVSLYILYKSRLNGERADIAKQMELDNYKKTIFEMMASDPYMVDRFVEIARDAERKRSGTK